MAGRMRQMHRYFNSPATAGEYGGRGGGGGGDEFDESDIWGTVGMMQQADSRQAVDTPPPKLVRALLSRKPKISSNSGPTAPPTPPSSMPVSIPDWSKILKQEYINRNGSSGTHRNYGEDEEEMVLGSNPTCGGVIPPHELLMWRNRSSSFSVHEGIGRTLKGRDLSRVRDAIWEQTGFQD